MGAHHPVEHAEVLDQARMAQFIRAAKTGDAKAIVRALREATIAHEASAHPRQRARKVDDLRTFEGAVGAFLSDLIYHAGNIDAYGFTYRPRDKVELADTSDALAVAPSSERSRGHETPWGTPM
jgi:hypothetical protein